MGGAVVSRTQWEGRAAYENWTVPAVRSTIEELEQEYAGQELSDVQIDRAQYFNIFHNYLLRNDESGTEMSLPLEHFQKYVNNNEAVGANGQQVIFVRRPLIMLALLAGCAAGSMDRLELLMRLEAGDKTKSLDPAGLTKLLQDVAEGMNVVGAFPQDPQKEDVANIAHHVWRRAEEEGPLGAEGLNVHRLFKLTQHDFQRAGRRGRSRTDAPPRGSARAARCFLGAHGRNRVRRFPAARRGDSHDALPERPRSQARA